jgi:hypothetical protein
MEQEQVAVSAKDQWLQGYARECEITMRVLKAYPEDKLDMKPAEVLRSACDLAWVFAGEGMLGQVVVQNKFAEMDPNTPMPTAP